MGLQDKQAQAQWFGAQILDTDCRGSDPGSGTYELRDPEPAPSPVCASLSVKRQ